MPALLNTRTRVETLTACLCLLVAREGLSAPSLRALASEARLSVGSLTHHLDSKERAIRVLVCTFLHAMGHQVECASWRTWSGFLPSLADRSGVADLRSRAAFLELARSSPDLGEVVAGWRARERLTLSRHLGGFENGRFLGDPGQLDIAEAALEGLRVLVCDRTDPMTLARAHDVWARLGLLLAS